MSKRLIGYGYTNVNGVATLDYDAEGNELQSSGYVGQGVGNVDISASAVIDGSTFVSGTLSVWDTKWFDDGTDSTHSMFGSSSTMTVNYGTEECTLTETTSGTTGVVVTDTNHYIQPNDIFEFDYLQVDGQRNFSTIYVRNKANGTTLVSIPHLYDMSKQLDTWVHLKCQISDNKLTVYVDDNPTPIEKTLSNTDTDYRLYWNTNPTRDIHTIKFKNFKVYSG